MSSKDLFGYRSLDEFLSLTQDIGSVQKAVTNSVYGINATGVKGVIPENRDSHGYVFFTRPQLNLSRENILNYRKFIGLLDTREYSMGRYIRCMLDPSLYWDNIRSELCDPRMAFIPCMTNTIKTVSGFPDVGVNTFTSKPGLNKEQWFVIDSGIEVFDQFDLSCTFRNTRDESVLRLIHVWTAYQSLIFSGKMVKYMEMRVQREIDYNTRIYVLVLDETKRFVKKIAATGASAPISLPMGSVFDYNSDIKYSDSNRDFTINFRCVGADYNDSITIVEFNKTNAIFNPQIRNMLNGYGHYLEKVPVDYLRLFNYRAYPIINTNTYELEWYVDTRSNRYKFVIEYIKNMQSKSL